MTQDKRGTQLKTCKVGAKTEKKREVDTWMKDSYNSLKGKIKKEEYVLENDNSLIKKN